MALLANIQAVTQRLKGIRRADASAAASVRTDGYGGLVAQQMYDGMMGLNDEGSFYVATNPTLDSPIAVTTSIIAYAETAGAVGVAFLLRNSDVIGGATSKRLIMSYLKLMIVGVPTSATSWKYAAVIDDNPVRYTSGGSVITSIYNCNGDMPAAGSIATCQFGALTTAVPTNKRYIGHGMLRGVIPTTFDEYLIKFGWGDNGSMASAAASGSHQCLNGPGVLAPGQNLAVTLWGASNGAASTWEFEAGWIER